MREAGGDLLLKGENIFNLGRAFFNHLLLLLPGLSLKAREEEAGTTWDHISMQLQFGKVLVSVSAANQGLGGEAGKWGDDDGRESGVEQRTPC